MNDFFICTAARAGGYFFMDLLNRTEKVDGVGENIHFRETKGIRSYHRLLE